jgi:hypothetical protein
MSGNEQGQKCPRCGRDIDLGKKQSLLQKMENKIAMSYTKKMMGGKLPKDMPEIRNYYCDCGLHITLAKDKNEKWGWVTAS